MAIKVQSNDIYAIMHGERNLPGTNHGFDANTIHQAYNALDSAVTLRVAHALLPRVEASSHASGSYQFVRAMQAPALDMMQRGVAIQPKVRADETERYLAIQAKAQTRLDALADTVWGPEEYEEVIRTSEMVTPLGKRGQFLAPRTVVRKQTHICTRPRGLNAASNKQMLAFFNIALRCPVEYEIRKTPQGKVRTPTANDKALRKWASWITKGPGVDRRDRTVEAIHFVAPFVSLVLSIRECAKKLEVLNLRQGKDGRAYCSYNVAGTENARWSSSPSAFGVGRNMQNIEAELRRQFCADDGRRFISTDLEQAESRLVGALVWEATGDDTYWLACEGADLHTTVCQMTWPELGWTDDPAANRTIADRDYPGLGMSFRDVAKRVGHGTNYWGTAFGIAQAVGVPRNLVEDFQRRYFTAFPAIRDWHGIIGDDVRSAALIDTPLGRRRHFFGRPWEDGVRREAIAYSPQSTIGEHLNLVLWRCWVRSLPAKVRSKHFPHVTGDHLPIQLHLQNHDAFLFSTPETTSLPWLLQEVRNEFSSPIPFQRGDEVRQLIIPAEFVTGWNWAYKDKGDKDEWTFPDGNPDGLTKWKGSDERRRVQGARSTPADWLDRPLHRQF